MKFSIIYFQAEHINRFPLLPNIQPLNENKLWGGVHLHIYCETFTLNFLLKEKS